MRKDAETAAAGVAATGVQAGGSGGDGGQVRSHGCWMSSPT